MKSNALIVVVGVVALAIGGCGASGEEPEVSESSNQATTDCAGTSGGSATIDECGTCDADTTNDCTQDCAGAWGGSATADECGTCDDDASNDCVQDCAGTWGGSATEDACGVCDSDANNDNTTCTEDCAGTWGGSATEDACGVCDSDANNDNTTCEVCTDDSECASGHCYYGYCTPEGMAYVPAGAFMMGCNEAVDDECVDDGSPYHEVTLDGYFIDIYEVTAGQYKTCVDAGECSYGGTTSSPYRTYNNGRDNHPINFVVWIEAKTYCEWLGKGLPTEAQWEKASRGTEGQKYPWGNSPSVSCDYAVMGEGGTGCGTGQTMEVGSKPLGVSPYGAHDMVGNVYEWVADWYHSNYYSQTPDGGWVNPQGPDSGLQRVLRGGAWYYNNTRYLRSSGRSRNASSVRKDVYGFRCSKSQ